MGERMREREVVRALYETLTDIMPQIGKIVLQDYAKLNAGMLEAARLLQTEAPHVRCSECKGTNVQMLDWVRPNDGYAYEGCIADNGLPELPLYWYCEDCEESHVGESIPPHVETCDMDEDCSCGVTA